ncbi:hypothetical protein D3C76_1158100 [compost metagenome]
MRFCEARAQVVEWVERSVDELFPSRNGPACFGVLMRVGRVEQCGSDACREDKALVGPDHVL